eukprot:2935350-Rhodomonas_salina.1
MRISTQHLRRAYVSVPMSIAHRAYSRRLSRALERTPQPQRADAEKVPRTREQTLEESPHASGRAG